MSSVDNTSRLWKHVCPTLLLQHWEFLHLPVPEVSRLFSSSNIFRLLCSLIWRDWYQKTASRIPLKYGKQKIIDPHSQLHLPLHSNFGGNFTAVKLGKYFNATLMLSSETRRELEQKCVPQLFLGSLLGTRQSAIGKIFSVPSNSPRSLCERQLAPVSFKREVAYHDPSSPSLSARYHY